MAPTSAFFGTTYGEAMRLLAEAHDYMAALRPEAAMVCDPATCWRLCGETIRLATRVSQIVAWLLAQRAVQAGAFLPEEPMQGQAALAELELCMEQAAEDLDGMPDCLVDLLRRSHQLYLRVARLDALARERLALA